MIKFTLLCDKGHDFEGWFSSNDDFDQQKKRGLVSCPMCDSPHVDKALMAPSVNVKRDYDAAPIIIDTPTAASAAPTSIPAPQSTVSAAVPPAAPAPTPEQVEQLAAQIEVMREFRKEVLKTSEDVGEKFTEEARKIHYGETEKRGIHGEAKLDDIKELVEEGIDILPLPVLPEDKN